MEFYGHVGVLLSVEKERVWADKRIKTKLECGAWKRREHCSVEGDGNLISTSKGNKKNDILVWLN